MAKPVTVIPTGGKPVVSAPGSQPATAVPEGGLPVTLVTTLGMPMTFDTPSTTVLYKSTQTTLVNEDTTTWSGVDIGVAHPNRLIILTGFYAADSTTVSATVNGIAQNAIVTVLSSRNVAIITVRVPTGTTADIVFTAVASPRKAVGVYVAYPVNPAIVASGTDAAVGAANNVVASKAGLSGGFAVYVGGQTAVLGAFTTTWGGADAVVEDADAQIEAASSYTMGHINFTSDNTNSLTMAGSVSGNKRLAMATFYPSA